MGRPWRRRATTSVPGAGAALAGHQLVADRREPVRPVVAAGGPHGLGGVVVAVVVVRLVLAAHPRRAARPVLHQVAQAALDGRVLVDAGGVQRDHAGGGAGEPRLAVVLEVAEAAVGRLAGLDEGGAAVGGALGHF